MTDPILDLSATIDVKFNGPMAITRYALTVSNPTNVAVEALYHFTLPREGSLMRCEVKMDGHRFSGQVMKRNDASSVHEEALETGRRSVLLESMNDGVYGLNVGNLDAGESLIIEMDIASLLTLSEVGQTRTYRLPTTLAPRYGQTGNDIEPEYSFFARYPFSATVSLPGGAKITSSSHTLLSETDSAILKGELDRDIFITWEQRPDNQLYTASYRNHTYTLGVPLLIPDQYKENNASARQLHVVLDRSGSMMGASIQHCREALLQVIRSMNDATFFNLTSFGSYHASLFKNAMKMTDDQRAHCLSKIGFIEADMGGTELVSALLHALRHAADDENPTHILLITDGNTHLCGEEVAAIELLCKQRSVNLHTVGVGYSVNTHALTTLSNTAPGTLHIVNPNGELSDSIENVVKLLQSDPLPSHVTWQDSPEWSATPSAWYPGLPQPVMAAGNQILSDAVHDLQWKPVLLDGEWAQALVHIAAAKQLHSMNATDATELSEELGLLSRYTSFVMLDTSESRINNEGVPTVIPQMTPTVTLGMNECCSSYLDIPAFLRRGGGYDSKPKDIDRFSAEQLGERLMDDLNSRWWRESRWTPSHLIKLGFDSETLEELENIEAKFSVPFSYVVTAFLIDFVINQPASYQLTARAGKRLYKMEAKIDTQLREAVADVSLRLSSTA